MAAIKKVPAVKNTVRSDTRVIRLRLPVEIAAMCQAEPSLMTMALENYAEEQRKRFQSEQPEAVKAEPGILEQADRLIHGDRQRDYGNKLQNFAQISMLWQGTLATKLQPEARISPEDVALCMMQVKIARLAKSSHHKDSVLDIAGYAGCYDELQREREAGTTLGGATVDYRP